ncbi:MAG: L-aspartate oxidase [Firmicutes bacterium]|nr:L-aspartate oxidase [Bacillota bacterium]
MAGRYLVNFSTSELPRDESDYVILGSGIAGLYTALAARRTGAEVLVLTKRTVEDSTTDQAQGGIAAAVADGDSPAQHLADTLEAGAGLCDPEAVEILVTEGVERVRELVALGARFDRTGGNLALTREGAHSRRRILHARGDATGAEIQRVLAGAARERRVEILENHFVVDLLVREQVCHGVLACDPEGRLRVFFGRVVVLATGGLGRIYATNTNPDVASGDGVAMAYRAGAEVMDLEFVQFHPTALALPGAPRFLISEAVRGEGGVLRNARGERFMERYHPMRELAPRDVVVRAILAEMEATGAPHVFLDLTHLPGEEVRRRFPNITARCARLGLDVTREPVPVAPAAHYAMGGVRTDLYGETSLHGLFACGEVACAGVHGANRLASNSLLDGLVFGGRVVRRVLEHPDCYPTRRVTLGYEKLEAPAGGDWAALRAQIQGIMDRYVGPVRHASGLARALDFFDAWRHLEAHAARTAEEMEVRNMLLTAELVTLAASMRTESRGGHHRADFPNTDRRWERHIIMRRRGGH